MQLMFNCFSSSSLSSHLNAISPCCLSRSSSHRGTIHGSTVRRIRVSRRPPPFFFCALGLSTFFFSAQGAHSSSASAQPLFQFGVVADIQYADVEDSLDFHKINMRRYRGSLEDVKGVLSEWRREGEDFAFVANLGDLIDQRNRDTDSIASATAQALEVLEASQTFSAGVLHAVGNHELYNFNRQQLAAGQYFEGRWFGCGVPPAIRRQFDVESDDGLYYAVKVAPGWRVVVLDSYDESIMGEGGGRVGIELTEKNGGLNREAAERCQAKNPNNVTTQTPYFDSMPAGSLDRRWNPCNGAMGDAQLEFLRRQLRSGDRLIVLSHALLHPGLPVEGLYWNYDRILQEIYAAPFDTVPLVLNGHVHRHYHTFDPHSGTLHMAVAAPLLTPESHAKVRVFADRIEIVGSGDVSSLTVHFEKYQGSTVAPTLPHPSTTTTPETPAEKQDSEIPFVIFT